MGTMKRSFFLACVTVVSFWMWRNPHTNEPLVSASAAARRKLCNLHGAKPKGSGLPTDPFQNPRQPEPSKNFVGHKVGAAVVLCLIAAVGCCVPFYLDRRVRSTRKTNCLLIAMHVVNAFAGGAFLGLALFHLLPEATAQLDEADVVFTFDGNRASLVCYLLAFVGFAFMIMLEHTLYSSHDTCAFPVRRSYSSYPTMLKHSDSLLSMNNGGECLEPRKEELVNCSGCESPCCSRTVGCDSCVQELSSTAEMGDLAPRSLILSSVGTAEELMEQKLHHLSLSAKGDPDVVYTSSAKTKNPSISSPGLQQSEAIAAKSGGRGGRGGSSATPTSDLSKHFLCDEVQRLDEGSASCGASASVEVAAVPGRRGENGCGSAGAHLCAAGAVGASGGGKGGAMSAREATGHGSCGRHAGGGEDGCRGSSSRPAGSESAGCGCLAAGGKSSRARCCACIQHCDHSHDTAAILRNQNGGVHGSRSAGRTGSGQRYFDVRQASEKGGPWPLQEAPFETTTTSETLVDLIQEIKVGRPRLEEIGLPSQWSANEQDGDAMSQSCGGGSTGVLPPPPRCGRALHVVLVQLTTPALFISVALGVHSVFEGIVVGTSTRVATVWVTTLVIIGHKGAAGFALSAVFLKRRLSRRQCCIFLAIFLLASPAGVFIGIAAVKGGVAAAGVLNALGAGTVLYIANEVVTSELASGGKVSLRWLQFLAFLLGAAVVFGLTLAHFTLSQI